MLKWTRREILMGRVKARMEPERFAERMLEAENLTDELEDGEAQRLLDWGLAELGRVLRDVQDAQLASERASTLMSVMRKINRLVGGMAGKDAAELAEELATLIELHASADPHASAPDPQSIQQAAARLAELNVRDALELVFQLNAPAAAKPAAPNPLAAQAAASTGVAAQPAPAASNETLAQPEPQPAASDETSPTPAAQPEPEAGSDATAMQPEPQPAAPEETLAAQPEAEQSPSPAPDDFDPDPSQE